MNGSPKSKTSDDYLSLVFPLARDGAVAFDGVRKVSDIAVAMRETQEPGRYRLVPGTAGEIFGVVNGAGSLKPFFFAPEETLLEVTRERRGFKVSEVAPAAPRLAFIGVRACDLAALAVQDRIDQFGTSGCVGCGRCMTWCPVGIDLTEEVAAIRAHPVKR